ncbi:MAG: endopeptidase La [Deltaproteobacteria bacterium]|nr:endopeptidase La [Deltaproteobacteria bacterium]
MTEQQAQVEGGGDLGLPELPDTLPVLPLKNNIIFPQLLAPLVIGSARSRRLVDAVMAGEPRLMLALSARGSVEGSPGPDDLYRVGTLLRVVKMLRTSDSYHLLVQGLCRARLLEWRAEQPFLQCHAQPLADTGESETVEVQALARYVRDSFIALVSESSGNSNELQALTLSTEDPAHLADLVASNLPIDVAGRQAFLEELDIRERLNRVREELRRASDAAAIESKIREKVKSEMGRTQREYMLRQQLDQIRRELGEGEDEEAESETLRRKIEEAGMSEEAQAQALREHERMAQMPAAAAERSFIRNYLDWMVDLPWSRSSEDRLDVEAARRVLDEDHWGLEKVKDRIVEYIAVLSLKRQRDQHAGLRGPILCFVGPPGTGKTSLGRSIARALGRSFQRISLGGVRDEAEIRGHRRTYVGALPGRIIQGLRRAEARNPVFVLDEVDKVGADYHGDPSSALLEVLDPEQNSTFSDHYLEVPFDLSQVLFIATANVEDPIHPALRDRMEIIELPGYTEEDKLQIAQRFLLPRQRRENGVAGIELEIPAETLRAIVRSYTREAGVRNLEREIGAVCRKIVRRVASGAEGGFRVAPEDLAELLGPVKFEPELAERAGRPGVAVGLSWTPAGGDILFVESTAMPGRGALKLTGSLGDVMRESAEAARAWLQSYGQPLGIPAGAFEKRDLHVHVPQGAVPKDGPSAGVAMVTALASLLTGRAADPDVAMTGEITLRGKVLPVGGIKEKVLAARRAGIHRVVLPEKNRRDVEEIQPELLDGLSFSYIGRIADALECILPPEPPGA